MGQVMKTAAIALACVWSFEAYGAGAPAERYLVNHIAGFMERYRDANQGQMATNWSDLDPNFDLRRGSMNDSLYRYEFVSPPVRVVGDPTLKNWEIVVIRVIPFKTEIGGALMRYAVCRGSSGQLEGLALAESATQDSFIREGRSLPSVSATLPDVDFLGHKWLADPPMSYIATRSRKTLISLALIALGAVLMVVRMVVVGRRTATK
jgi:hypothetical protein